MQAEPDMAEKAGRKQFVRHGTYLWTALFGVMVVCVAGSAAVMQTEPKVVVQGGSTYEAGLVHSRRLSHDFVLYNPHPYFVTVGVNAAGCACTTASLDKPIIGPYGHLPVHVGVDVEDDGPQTEGAKVVTSHAGRTAQAWLFVSFNADLKHGTNEGTAK